ncbi:site-2 protease family protein [Psychrobacillus sp. FJAT-51614]|uniref:Site-2 protease family protein n=1 Tax=Psychrobacillus mangrovi TaxID=3117745 RepID=A0ABU8F5X7_9BACI
MYSIVFGSLLFHELGHLLAAKLIGVKIISCTILPYGGEIRIEQFSKFKKVHQFLIVISGPFFTLLLLAFTTIIDIPQKNIIVITQILILCINLLPIYPLDGGRVLYIFNPTRYNDLVGFSLVFSFLIFCASLYYFPRLLSVSIIFLYLFILNISFWRFRKYKLAFDNITRSA